MIRCPTFCGSRKVDRGRAADGRRAYRCRVCGATWTSGMQGRRQQFSDQRPGYQFADTGAAKPGDRGKSWVLAQPLKV